MSIAQLHEFSWNVTLIDSHSCVCLYIYLSFFTSNKQKTFRPRKDIEEGTRQYTLYKYSERTLGTGNLKKAVSLPPNENLNEWLAVNSKYTTLSWAGYVIVTDMFVAIDFYNQVNLLYGSITEFCTPSTCPVMNAGPKYAALVT
jgi:MOB kinase activator 1